MKRESLAYEAVLRSNERDISTDSTTSRLCSQWRFSNDWMDTARWLYIYKNRAESSLQGMKLQDDWNLVSKDHPPPLLHFFRHRTSNSIFRHSWMLSIFACQSPDLLLLTNQNFFSQSSHWRPSPQVPTSGVLNWLKSVRGDPSQQLHQLDAR